MLFTSSVWSGFEDPHNGYLDVLAGTGAVGLALFIAWCVSGLFRAQRTINRRGAITASSAMLVLAVAWMSAAMVESSPFSSSSPSGVVGYLAMCAISMASIRDRRVANALRLKRGFAPVG